MGVNGIYGLSGSGIDVESMVKVGMMTKQSEYDKMYKKSIKETWEKEAYASIYSDLSTFKETVATYNKQSTMNAMTASSSNTSAVMPIVPTLCRKPSRYAANIQNSKANCCLSPRVKVHWPAPLTCNA